MNSRFSLGAAAPVACMFLLALGPPAQAQNCNAGTPIVCTHGATYTLWEYNITLDAGATYVFSTDKLSTLSGQSNTPDTMIWLVDRVGETLLEVDDDGNTSTSNPYDSKITFTPSSLVRARVIVAAYSAVNFGSADISILRNSVEQLPGGTPAYGVTFGGWSLYTGVKDGDWLYLGGDSDNVVHDNRMYLFYNRSAKCTGGSCGDMLGYNMGLTTSRRVVSGLSMIPVDATDTSVRVLVGSALPDTPVAMRLMHRRLHSSDGGLWTGTDQTDSDKDGLTWEVEEVLGTCDTASGPAPDCASCAAGFPVDCPAGSCLCFADRAGFAPDDSDNDGLNDFAEVFGMSKTCSSSPVPPFYHEPTGCTDIGLEGCSGTGQPCGAQMYTVAFSALGADPRAYDVYVEVDSLGSPSESWLLTTDMLDDIDWVYRQEGLECPSNHSTDPADCIFPNALDRHHSVVPHIYNDDYVGETSSDQSWGEEFARTHYFYDFTRSRRYHPGFRYAVAVDSGGQAKLESRHLVFGGGWVRDEVFVHELGHTLGLDHQGVSPNQWNNKLNYPSLMNYAYDYENAKKPATGPLWPADHGDNCTTGSQCTSGRCACLTAPCPPNSLQCDIDCSQSGTGYSLNDRIIRFSRGMNASILETNHADAPQGSKLPAEAYCADGACGWDGPQWSFCDSSYSFCYVDWNGNGTVDVPTSANVDGNCVALSVASAVDENDFESMYDRGRDGFDESYENGYVMIYHSKMEGDADDTWTGSGISPTEQGSISDVSGVTNGSGVKVFGDALHFSGPLTSPVDRLTIASNDLFKSMGETVSGTTPDGFSLLLQFKLDNFTNGAGHVLIQNNLFSVWVSNSTQRLTLWVNDGGGSVFIGPPNSLSSGTWYRLRARWNPRGSSAHRLIVSVLPWNGSQWDDSMPINCADTLASAVTEIAVGDTYLGGVPVAGWALTGALDHVVLYNYPDEGQFGNNINWGCGW